MAKHFPVNLFVLKEHGKLFYWASHDMIPCRCFLSDSETYLQTQQEVESGHDPPGNMQRFDLSASFHNPILIPFGSIPNSDG